MPTSTSTVTITTRSSAEEAIAALRDLQGWGSWLARSPVYRGTSGAVPRVAVVGDTYADHTVVGAVRGEVTRLEAGRLIEFRQANRARTMSFVIRYEAAPTESGARVSRTGQITTRGLLAWGHPLVVVATRWENRRTMRALRDKLDAGTH
ncbi:SRPBCC family protein [Sinomonas sp. ASV322]|uniref:SRPBCC family protein n=1 Tax=Sinomonas sp. ASV322 TaxID=3041920 RepID=UPI0027DD5620|nr:SRPBCC family protein [Sinomonas sp. ASV322]MDQ4503718.1 SRPBCC family protein [Sinomonas sp. ASV322]